MQLRVSFNKDFQIPLSQLYDIMTSAITVTALGWPHTIREPVTVIGKGRGEEGGGGGEGSAVWTGQRQHLDLQGDKLAGVKQREESKGEAHKEACQGSKVASPKDQ